MAFVHIYLFFLHYVVSFLLPLAIYDHYHALTLTLGIALWSLDGQ